MITLPETLHEILNSTAFQRFEESKLGNDLFISDSDRASRIYDAVEHGCDGSTHSEHIDDQREHLDDLRREALGEAWGIDDDKEQEAREAEIEAWHSRLSAELDAIELWHETNGSLHTQVG